MDGSVAIRTSHVRLSIAQKATMKAMPIPSIMHKIMNKIRDIDSQATFHDILGKPVSMENFPVDKDVFDAAFGTIVPEGRNAQVILGLTINTTMTFGSIKAALMPTLQYLNTFMRPHHSTTWSSLDAVPIAHLHEIHPSFADTTQVMHTLTEMLEQCLTKVSDEEEYKTLLGNKPTALPEIMLYTGRALGRLGTQDMTSDVLEIYVARPYISLMKYLFQVSTTLPHRTLQVVPRDFKFNHPAIYGKILNKQNDYLENHRNIAIVAVPLAAMEHCITDHDGKTWKTLKEAILAVEGITHVHACKRTTDLGKWNISTNIGAWEHVKTWIDKHLNALYRRIPVGTRNKYPDFPEFISPTRLHARRHQAPFNSTAVMDAYANIIQTSILGTDTVKIPTRARAPAWKSTPRLVYTLDDMNAFPPMKPAAADDRSTGSTGTTTSLTIATDDAIKKLETQWKTDKEAFSINLDTTLNARLATMDTKIDNVISTINDTVTQAFQKEMATFEAKMTKLVTDTMTAQTGSIVTQVASSITSDSSPYVTATVLQLTLETFLQKIETRIDKLTQPYAIDPRSPPRKQPKTTPIQDIPMDIEPTEIVNPYAGTPPGVAGQKN
jgi:hypothetical protein